MPNRFAQFLLAVIVMTLTACDSMAVYDEYHTVPNKWHKDSVQTFRVEAPDTLNPYNLFINLRNTNDYRYNNLYLIAELNYPNGKVLKDTLQYRMADADGAFLGSGFSDLKENKLWYKGNKEPFVFEESGEYLINIQHAMRENGEVYGVEELEGITEIGIRVEHTQNKLP